MLYAGMFENFGYHVYETGGGCRAWKLSMRWPGPGRPHDEAAYVLVTSGDGCDVPTADDSLIMVGLYEGEPFDDLEPTALFVIPNSPAAIGSALTLLSFTAQVGRMTVANSSERIAMLSARVQS